MFLAIRRPDIVKIYYFTELIALLAEIYSQILLIREVRVWWP